MLITRKNNDVQGEFHLNILTDDRNAVFRAVRNTIWGDEIIGSHMFIDEESEVSNMSLKIRHIDDLRVFSFLSNLKCTFALQYNYTDDICRIFGEMGSSVYGDDHDSYEEITVDETKISAELGTRIEKARQILEGQE